MKISSSSTTPSPSEHVRAPRVIEEVIANTEEVNTNLEEVNTNTEEVNTNLEELSNLSVVKFRKAIKEIDLTDEQKAELIAMEDAKEKPRESIKALIK